MPDHQINPLATGLPAGEASAPFVVPDACTVFRDALSFTPWTDEGGSLPQRGDWSTYRLASKDIILGVVTHRFNATTKSLDVRSYFSGEHPIFQELEPTRALMVMLLCQAFQTGNSLQINFEQGVPFDVRTLIEERTGTTISGHTSFLARDVTEPLFINLSGISSGLQARIKDQGVGVGTVCYQIFRGTWSSFQINALLDRGVPLTWLFRKSPHAVGNPAPYLYLAHHLCAVLLEEYALKRLENRQFGETTSKRVSVIEGEPLASYVAAQSLQVDSEDGNVQIAGGDPFVLLPLLIPTTAGAGRTIHEGLDRARRLPEDKRPLLVMPMDFLCETRASINVADLLRDSGANWLIVGQTMAQLSAEVEQKLAITAEQMDENEVDASNVDRHTD
jgi:hypothetical protein